MLHNRYTILSNSHICIDFGLWLCVIAFELELDVLFLEVGQPIISVYSPFFSVEGVDDDLNEQVGDEKGPEDHVDDEDILVDWILSSLGLKANASRVNSIVHEYDPSFGGTHCE